MNHGGEHCARFDLRHSAGALNDFRCNAVGAFACERNRWDPQLLLLLLLLLLPCVHYAVVELPVDAAGGARRGRTRLVSPAVGAAGSQIQLS